ncbi:Neuropeptide CCHamide-2 receptor [Holothuria leucospilota]|nr:Neuropeptide CCHamide-2 receptor [Holothuria leucospilota]
MTALATLKPFCEETQEVQDEVFLIRVAFAIIAILGITGNSLVLVVFYKGRELRVVPNILVGHQSLVDLILSIVLILMVIFYFTEVTSVTISQPFLKIFLCKIWFSDYVYWAMMKVSTTNLVFVTLERYCAVVLSSKYRRSARKNISLAICISAWFVGF